MTTQKSQTVQIVDAVMKLKEVLEKQAKVADLKTVMRHLFAGNAEVTTDNQGQLVVYTGYTYGAHTEDVMTMENDPEGFPQFWCKND
tara:strand:+ start:1018 stop:1278 length:261 start_codon:yes stop_codon:yes gene_type:complete